MKHQAPHRNRSASARGQRPSRPAAPGPIRRPERLPFLDAICKKLNQRVNLADEQSVLALYERGWIFHNVLGTLKGEEARYVRSLASRYQSWILRQVA